MVRQIRIKLPKKIYIKDTSSQDARTLIQNHWSEFDRFEFYNLHIDTAKWAWDAEIYAHTQEYGTVLLRSYGSDVPSVFYGKLYSSVWTWQELATMDKVPESVVNPTELDTNKFLKSGYYSLGDPSNRTNLPAVEACTLLVFNAGYYIIQEIFTNVSNGMYYRKSLNNGSTWSAWFKVSIT